MLLELVTQLDPAVDSTEVSTRQGSTVTLTLPHNIILVYTGIIYSTDHHSTVYVSRKTPQKTMHIDVLKPQIFSLFSTSPFERNDPVKGKLQYNICILLYKVIQQQLILYYKTTISVGCVGS